MSGSVPTGAAVLDFNGSRRSTRLWALALLGFAGSVLSALTGPRAVGGASPRWWYLADWPPSRESSIALLYVGMGLMCLAWLGLGRLVATRAWRTSAAASESFAPEVAPSTAQLVGIGALWFLPLALGPALFSRDVYSYLAQGTILHLGLSPYQYSPDALAGLGHGHVLAAVSPFWRHTTAPYGPLFLWLLSLIAGVAGSNLVLGVLLIRLLELVGVGLLAVFLPRLARAFGTDPARAVWFALLSPLVALELVAAGHNDVLMIGLLAAGVAVALEGRPMAGIAICALAATIKVPALAAAVFIAVAWARAEDTPAERARSLASSALVVVVVLAAVSVVTGLGVGWLSASVFSTPAKVRLAITPATGVGWTVASLLHTAGFGVDARSLESAGGAVALAITAVAGVVLLHRVRIPQLAVYLGAFLLAAAAGGPAAWPWYFSWGLVLLAACRGPQRSAALAIAIAASAFLVKPNGILALPLQSAPVVISVYALIASAAWYAWRRRGGDRGAAGRSSPNLRDRAPSALARS